MAEYAGINLPSPTLTVRQTEDVRIYCQLGRHWKLILTCGIIGAAIAVGVTNLLPPRYASTATLMLDPLTQRREAASADQYSLLPPSEETVRKNEMAFIRSRLLAEQVITELGLTRDPEFNIRLQPPSTLQTAISYAKAVVTRVLTVLGYSTSPGPPSGTPSENDRVVDQFIRHLDVTGPDASRIVEIRFYSVSPEKAARIAQTVANRAIDQRTADVVHQARNVSKSLEEDIARANKTILDTELKIESIRRGNGNIPLASLKILEESISEISKQIATASGERAAAEGRLNEFQAAKTAGRVDTLPAVLSSLLIQRLQADAAQIATKISGATFLYDRANPKLAELRATLQGLHTEIDREVDRIGSTYKSDFDAARVKEVVLRRSVEQMREQLATARISDINIRLYERQADVSRTLLSQLITALSNTQAQIGATPVGERIISDATIASVRSFPTTAPMAVLGFVLFATCGGFLALGLDPRNSTIRSAAQLRGMTDARMLGAIPTVGNRHSLRRRKLPAFVLTDPRSMFVDSLRAVWLQIERVKSGPPKTVLMTSSVSGEGKSAIAASLTRMLAIGGHSVAIVDADLRDPKVHRMLELPLSPGLADLLAGSASLNDVLQRDKASSAWIVPAGIANNSPMALLGSAAMSQVVADLAARFAFIIIDSPPVLAVPDTRVIAQLCDTTVMAVRWGGTHPDAFALALELLRDAGISVQGVMLTMVNRQQYAQYGYMTGRASETKLTRYAA